MNPVPTSPLADDLATAPTDWDFKNQYQDANPVPTIPLADDLATVPGIQGGTFLFIYRLASPRPLL